MKIITAWAENCSGPGWVNTPIWYIYEDVKNEIRMECLQPKEQTPELLALFEPSAAMNKTFVPYVEDALKCLNK